ncbi:hypothetical protein DAPPUDRAFT_95129 [Daphnia pulex]|uniref:Secreted protein n=1 Tax=Daphnia pulex TaxID=6669 RepID=E9FU03_DAPPU|nr:hypothetical protein DAPPUDRAFT_95129 [Daphnia pulex]|eukprot:EFX89458.1 hypothetical protein DAPPUDRAFT_95129 [Daphnia pulex]
MGLLWCGLGMGWPLTGWLAVSSEDEGEERNENSWQLQFPLSCVRIESLCDSVGSGGKSLNPNGKRQQHSTAQHTIPAGRDREEEEDGGSEKFRMFWQRRKRFFPQQQPNDCCVVQQQRQSL